MNFAVQYLINVQCRVDMRTFPNYVLDNASEFVLIFSIRSTTTVRYSMTATRKKTTVRILPLVTPHYS